MFKWICNRLRGSDQDSVGLRDLASRNEWNLLSLTPAYQKSEHETYVKALATAVRNDDLRNIALSGTYGVGKSSILRELANHCKGRVIKLSLSTLAPSDESNETGSVPKQAASPTNRIQQEIVKQLLYRAHPRKTPSSRFHRIGRFNWWREMGVAALLGFLITLLVLVTGWSTQITSVLGSWAGPRWDFAIVWVVAAVVALLARYLFYGQFYVTQFSAGSATVALDDKSVSYFDQYLDEIVYFFEMTERDIVIFEDIDRFNNSRIFETLRSLNTLLNDSPQINRTIRFIYAVKDSIFEDDKVSVDKDKCDPVMASIDDPALREAVRANRTKFFDLIIPVVPFITHQSARNLAVQLLEEINVKVDPALIDLAAQYVPDMRMLKNIRNEFVVFRDRIFSGAGKKLELGETELYAMMLYKSTHFADFEAIRVGKSNLDRLYEISRQLVNHNSERLHREKFETQEKLNRNDTAGARSKSLGEALVTHIERTINASPFDAQQYKYSFNNEDYSSDDLKSASFWNFFTSTKNDVPLKCTALNRGQRNEFSFSKDDLATALSESLDAESWNESLREEISDQLRRIENDLAVLKSADPKQLIRRADLRVDYNKKEQCFDEVAREILGSGLAYHVLRSGYINSYFNLYISTFHDVRVGPAAMNFIILHVERDAMDPTFKLKPEEVEQVVRERKEHALEEPALYNIDILDHLLQTDPPKAKIMVHSLASFGERQNLFMRAYLSGGAEQSRLIEHLTPITSKVLTFLVDLNVLDDDSRLRLTNVALAYLDGSMEYTTNSAVSSYLAEHYAQLTTLTSDKNLSSTQAKAIGSLFEQAEVTLPLLEPLSEKVRKAFVERSLYEIVPNNLRVVAGKSKSLAMDVLQSTNQTAYQYVLDNLGRYIATVESLSPTIESKEHFISVIEMILEHDGEHLDDVIARASPTCVVEDLTVVSTDAWPPLALYKRFHATFENVQGYINSVGTLDSNLAKVLTDAKAITIASNTADDDAKVTLAKTILAAKDSLPSADLRVKLVKSLDLPRRLTTEEVDPEPGKLFSLLIRRQLIEDSEETYAHLETADWPAREAFIRVSKKFSSYVVPSLVKHDLARLLQSPKIDLSLKKAIVAQAEGYIAEADRSGAKQLAQFAINESLPLTPDALQGMADNHVNALLLIPLLEPHLGSIDLNKLCSILESIGGDYSKLMKTGREGVKVPDTQADRALLDVMKTYGSVTMYKPQKSQISVFRKQK